MLVRYRIPVKEPTWIILATLHVGTSVLSVTRQGYDTGCLCGLANCHSKLNISVSMLLIYVVLQKYSTLNMVLFFFIPENRKFFKEGKLLVKVH